MGNLYVRVDDRLIHGQIVTAWCGSLGIKEIIAIDDSLATNKTLQSITLMGIPAQYKPKVVTLQQAKELLRQESAGNRMVITRFTSNLAEIREEIKGCGHINLGNCGMPESFEGEIHKIPSGIGRYVWLTDKDVQTLNELQEDGNKIICQVVPSEKGRTWESMKEEL